MQYIIATHGRLALGYVDTIRLVTQVEGLHAVCAYMEDSEFPEDMERLLNSFAPGEPVIVFTDLPCHPGRAWRICWNAQGNRWCG